MANDSLLPPNTSPLERNLEQAMRFDLPVPIRELWSIEECPEHLLPWLGWSLGVDFWHLADTPRKRRDLIKNAIAWHKKRGTPWAVKQALATLGYQVEELIEQGEYRQRWLAAGGRVLDGSWQADGQYALKWTANLPDNSALRRLSLGHWAEYAIRVSAAEGWGRDDQAAVRNIAERYAPARAHLVAIISNWRALFHSHIRNRSLRYRLLLQFDACQRLSVHQRPTLNGCWPLRGSQVTQTLDGWALSRFISLDGVRAVSGFAWATGQLAYRTTLRMRLRQHMTGPAAQIRLAGQPRQLNGRWSLSEQVLDGFSRLNSQLLGGALLIRHAAQVLDGWPLQPTAIPHISHQLRLTLRHNGGHP